MSKNIIVKFGSDAIDCTSYLRRAIKTTTYGDAIAKYEFEFAKNVNEVIELDNTLAVAVWEDSSSPPTTKVFDGFMDLIQPETGVVKITAKDQLATLINKQLTHIYDKSIQYDGIRALTNALYPDGKISLVFDDIVNYEGLSTNSGATVQDSGTEIIWSNFVCRNADPFERCRKCAETLNWVFYYRADTGYVYFEPKNYTVNANTLTVGVNIVEIPNWEFDRSEMINDLRLEGAQQLVQATQRLSGTGAKTTYDISNTPEDIAVYYSAAKNYSTTAKLASEIIIGDIVGATSTHSYEVDKKNKQIIFTGFTPANGTDNILVEMSYYAPVPVHLVGDISIAAYGTYAKTITLTDTITLNDAWKRAENVLSKYSVPFKSAKLKCLWTNTLSPVVGQSIHVVDNISSIPIDQYFTIYKVIDYYPENITEIEVGDKQYTIEEYQANVLERTKRLEEIVVGPTDAITEIRNTTITTDLVPESTEIVVKLANDSFLLDDTINSIMYNSDETSKVEDFENKNDWTGTGLTIAFANDDTSGHFWVGTQGVNATWTNSSGTGTMSKTISSSNLQNVVGVASGTPSQGTAGIWMWIQDSTKISQIKLRIGSSSSNYKGYIAQTYAQRNSLVGAFTLQNGMNYLVFDLNTPDETLGTTNWTAITYIAILFTVTAAS